MFYAKESIRLHKRQVLFKIKEQKNGFVFKNLGHIGQWLVESMQQLNRYYNALETGFEFLENKLKMI